jgi:CheY-like chemotaxis protein
MKKQTILFIEDNLDILENTIEILEMEGYNVLGAPNGECGVELARNHKPDLIISDVEVPRINGYELLRIFKNDPCTSKTPFIFLSASAQREDIEKGKMAGADAYLIKPIPAEDLKRAISGFIEG